LNVNQDIYNYQTLRVYLYYRIVLASLLFLMYEAELASKALGQSNPELFRFVSLGYVFLSLASLALLLDRQSFRSTYKVLFLLLVDITALSVLVQASGGVTSGLGYLLVITAAVASMFLKGQLAIGFAALITIGIMVQTLFLARGDDIIRPLFGAGTLGFLIFVTAITFRYLTARIRTSSLEAAEKSEYARQLVQLAQHIVTRMRTGIAVIDDENKVELINDSALQLLELQRGNLIFGKDITQLSDLKNIIGAWRKNPVSGKTYVHPMKEGKEIRISFASLNAESLNLTILYVEDYRNLIQHAQQLKLASLGRLTASIAHEIRNPLGAISHAAQLLSESDNLIETDVRFTEIILQHSKRVNQIIENTMSLSKRKEPKAELIDLKEWIPLFIEEYSTAKSCEIEYSWDDAHPDIKMDPTHLRQILTNLFDNGLRYSMDLINKALIDVRTGLSQNDDTTYIEVIDHGAGVREDKVQDIFEPFYTTGTQGTGLGLYISRELCEINQATLNYQRTKANKSCFKINFPHHQRMI